LVWPIGYQPNDQRVIIRSDKNDNNRDDFDVCTYAVTEIVVNLLRNDFAIVSSTSSELPVVK